MRKQKKRTGTAEGVRCRLSSSVVVCRLSFVVVVRCRLSLSVVCYRMSSSVVVRRRPHRPSLDELQNAA